MDKEVVKEVNRIENEACEAGNKFGDEFSSIDKMIHRFPPGLGEIISSTYPSMVVPTFVAIGPYHHGKEHLEKMEPVKKAAAYFLGQRSVTLEQAVTKAAAHYSCERKSGEELALDDLDDDAKKVLYAVEEAGDNYLAEGMCMTKDNPQFADMILRDACFLLLYMDAYKRSYGGYGDYEVNEAMRRFLFINRHRINNDIMLLENQLPWKVIQVLMGLAKDQKLEEAVQYFIAAMGSSFKIHESSVLEPYKWDDEKNPPAHLLELLQRHKTEEPVKIIHRAEPGGGARVDDGDVENPLGQPLINQDSPPPPPPTSSATQAGKHQVIVSAISPRDLKEIGIKLMANRTEVLWDMSLEEGWFLSHLTLAPLSLSDTTASWLVNMAAFEVCTPSRFGDAPSRTAVCSYLALLSFFMVGTEDVRELRLMGLLRGAKSDDDVLAFFSTFKQHLPDYGTHFAKVMAGIEDYKQKRRIKTTLYRWVYNNWKTAGKVVSIVLTAVGAIVALINFYKALLSLIQK